MPIPPNQSFATATDIGTLTGTTPYTTTQDAFDGSVTVSDLYYSYTPVAGDSELLVYGYGDISNYEVQTTFWFGPAGAPTQIGGTAVNTPAQIDILDGVTAGQPIFFKFHKVSVGNANPSTLNIRIARAPNESAAVGDLFINDSSPGYPGIVMDPTTAAPKRYLSGFASGEGCLNLTDGTTAAIEAFDSPTGIRIYDAGLNLIHTPTMPDSSYTAALASNQIDTFWAAKSGGGSASIVTVTPGGVVGTPIAIASNVATLAPNSGNTKVYFAASESTANTPVKVVDTNTTTVTTFLAGVSGKWIGANLFMMTDDTLLVPYEETGVDTQILRYNESGTLLNTYTLTGVQNALEHIFGDINDPSYFCIWYQDATKNYFERVTVADGTRTPFGTGRYQFIEGVSQQGATASATVYSGVDFSCVPMLLRGTTPTIVQIPPFDCGSSTATIPAVIYGTDFGSDPTVTATDPNGNTIPFTITSHTTTQINGTLVVATCGSWTFTVCNGALCVSATVDTGTNYIMRRVRRFVLPPADQFRVFISRLEILAQTGVGLTTGQGSDPVVMFRISWDGGATWSNETQMSMGKIGEYFRRVYVNRLGSGRQPIAEIVVSDPVFVSLLDCYVDAEKGTS